MRARGSLRLLRRLPAWPGPLFSPLLHSPSPACGELLMTSPQSPLSFLSSVSQPHLLCPSLLRGPLPCPVWAPTHLPLPEAPGWPRAQGLTLACRSPCCRPSSATRPSTCMPWEPSISSARPQVSRALVQVGVGGLPPGALPSLLHPSGNLQRRLTVTPELFLWTVGVNQCFP